MKRDDGENGDRERQIEIEREKERERQSESQRETERQTLRDRDRQRDREREEENEERGSCIWGLVGPQQFALKGKLSELGAQCAESQDDAGAVRPSSRLRLTTRREFLETI